MTENADLFRRIEAECPAHQTRIAARALARYYNGVFRPLGITAEQFSLLIGIAGSDAPTIAELAERGGADATTLSRSVHNLERSNLVRGNGGKGRAGKRLTLTYEGRLLLDRAVVAWTRARRGLSDVMHPEETDDVRGIMSRLAVAANAASARASLHGSGDG